MNAIEMKPPAGPATYTTNARDERSETDPSRALTMREVDDLRWLWNHAAAELGLRSNTGAQLDRLEAEQLSKAAKDFESAWKRLLTRARKGWQPSKKRDATRVRSSAAVQAFIEHVGLQDGMVTLQSVEDVDAGAPLTEEQAYRRGLDIADLSDQRIECKEDRHCASTDPYKNDRVFVVVRRARAVLRRLVQIEDNHVAVLAAVYGPVVNGESREALRKRFGELTEIAVRYVASKRHDDDPSARALLRAKLTDESYITSVRRESGKCLRAAAEAYAETREVIPLRPAPRKPPYVPVYGPGEVGRRPLLGFRWSR